MGYIIIERKAFSTITDNKVAKKEKEIIKERKNLKVLSKANIFTPFVYKSKTQLIV
jgi:hypothetical protein